MHCLRRQAAIPVAAALAGLLAAAPAWAQGQGESRRWEIEGYGGFALPAGSDIGEGSLTLPPPGAPIITSSPVFPSRAVPSWFLGDGATLLNLVNQQFGVGAAIAPLDGALGPAALDFGNGLAAGVRVRRTLTARFSAEVSLDLLPASVDLSDELLAAAEAARASFVPAFEGLLSTGPFTGVGVTATSSSGGSALELALTGALVWRLAPAGGFEPYLTFGGGVVSGAGEGPSVTLEGNYRFRILDEVPIDETDRLTIRQNSRSALTGVLGAGLRRDVNDRWGVRFDGRVLIGPHTTTLLIDAAPQLVQGTPADFVESFTTPAVQFSNSPATGRVSTLSGALEGFEVFSADGLHTRVLITGGVFFRF